MSSLLKKKILNALPQIFTVIGVITALASLLTMNFAIIAISIVLIIVFVSIIIVRALKSDNNLALQILDEVIEPHAELEVRHARNESELKAKSDLDLECYGEHVMDYAGLLMWWGRYPQGSYELFEGRRLIGSIDIWPVPKRTFDLLVAGKLKERDFREDDICNVCNKHIYWYICDIIIEKGHRSFGKHGRQHQFQILKNFIEEVLEQWLNNVQALSDEKLELCALVASAQGENLLKKFGFHATANESPDGLPVYTRTTSISELRNDVQLIFKPQKIIT